MDTNIHAYVKRWFEKTKLTYREISDGSGVPQRTVEKVLRGEIVDPGVSTVEKIAAFAQKQEKSAA